MTFTGTLRPYQVEPVRRMVERKRMLLAAEQGLGKTTVAIAAIESMFDQEVITEPGLIICPGTLTQQWADKIEEFTEGTSIPMVIPAGSDSTLQQRAELYRRAEAFDADYVILSYNAVVDDWNHVRRLPKGFVVIDEASWIRGFRSQRSKAVKDACGQSAIRYGLTGTPIENGKPEELFSIMESVDPDVFGRWDLFDRTFIERNSNGYVSRYKNLPAFHTRLEEAMIRLRADDAAVAPYMPKKADGEPILVDFDPATWALYERIARDLVAELEQASKWGQNFDLSATYGRSKSSKTHSAADQAKGRIGQRLQALMMLCDHPQLLHVSSAKYVANSAKGRAGGSAYIHALDVAGVIPADLPTPKLDRASAWLESRLAADSSNKIVVFTRFVDMIDLIGERLDGLGVGWSPYSGRMTQKKKNEHLSRFKTDPACRVLVASDAGGFGLDIPEANLLLNYDEPDGAGAADQRNTRIVRTSSAFEWVSRNWIMMRGSVEERNHARLQQKRAVARAFIDKKGLNAKGGVDLTVSTLLRSLQEALASPPLGNAGNG